MPLTQELFGVCFATVEVDIIIGFVTTPEGNTCMMVVTDYFTKYTKVFPMKDHKAATCVCALVKGWILHLGVPLMLQGVLWQEMCHQLAICKTIRNPYRRDGQVEKFNRTLIQVLKQLVNKQMDDWDEQCDFVCLTDRVTNVSGVSPRVTSDECGGKLLMTGCMVISTSCDHQSN